MRCLIIVVLLGVFGCTEAPQPRPVAVAAEPDGDVVPDAQPVRKKFTQIPYPVNLNITTARVLEWLGDEDRAEGFSPLRLAKLTALGKTIYVDEDADLTVIPTLWGDDQNLASVELSYIHKGDVVKQRRFEAAIQTLVDGMGITDEEGFATWLNTELAQVGSPSAIYIDQLRFDCGRDAGGVMTWKMSRKPEGLPQGKLF